MSVLLHTYRSDILEECRENPLLTSLGYDAIAPKPKGSGPELDTDAAEFNHVLFPPHYLECVF